METHYPYSRYLQETFGGKTYKVVVASGLTCPTRDGSIDKGGCAFCDVRGSASYFGKQDRAIDVRGQLEKRLPQVRERFGAERFLAYFQSYTNTYSDVDYLRGIYTEALSIPGIQGLCIGTRPDCLPDAVLDLLEELAQTHYISLELGVQSFVDPTLLWLKRGHDKASSIEALIRTQKRAPHVHTCAHLMFGSPTDPVGTAREAALLLNDLGVRGAKLHQLMILKGTELGRQWNQKKFHTLSIEDYSALVEEFIIHLSPKIYLERLCATATHADECLAPEWSRERWAPHNLIRNWLTTRGVRQGTQTAGFLVSPNSVSSLLTY